MQLVARRRQGAQGCAGERIGKRFDLVLPFTGIHAEPGFIRQEFSIEFACQQEIAIPQLCGYACILAQYLLYR
jgi:hypothetical protein